MSLKDRDKEMVRMRRLELPRREAPDPKSGVSTNFTTSAHNNDKRSLNLPKTKFSTIVKASVIEI